MNSLADALEQYWTKNKFERGHLTNEFETRFCIMGLLFGYEDNPLPKEFRRKLGKVVDRLYFDQGVVISVINDTQGREAVIDTIRRYEES